MSMAANLRSGVTLSGMVKSYNRKGYGFILCKEIEQDIYFSRESLHPNLQTSDLAGEKIQFEIHRFPDGKLQARNLRALGDVSDFKGSSHGGNKEYGAGARAQFFSDRTNGLDEDRSRDWYCKACGERNFLKRAECYKCKTQKPMELQESTIAAPARVAAPAPKRHLSPHAGSRAMREMVKQQLAGHRCDDAASRSRSRASKKSSSSSSTSSQKKRKLVKKKKTKKNKKSSSSGSSSSSARSTKSTDKGGDDEKEASAQETSPAVEKAKAEALEKLMELKQVEPKEQRLKEWRLLLRQWHPDKNPENQEVATAVFQFLQKGKRLIDPS